ncbi:hypothetical protein IWW34DRAFT_765410 [Fusarium oxysporum f. sp. albedinis]|nr:hypothetical protein IWW34DRAFT_765410 [Fusarium oxysporum f. sp. albedinis]KAJ0137254.1 NADH-ubiquinone oxidoreductase subunit [Fusarium oxysporum f. sp. albedinis]
MSAPANDNAPDLRFWIQRWLDQTITCGQDSPIAADLVQLPMTKRPFNMVTPPQSTPGEDSPRKRKRREQQERSATERGNEVDVGEEDLDKTPSASSTSSIFPPAGCRFPPIPFSLAQPARSNSQSSHSLASSARKSTRRSASPVKPFTLKMLQKPVEYVEFADDAVTQLPVEIRQLYRDIKDLAVDREGFIPASLRAPLQGLLPDAKTRYYSEYEHWDPSGAMRELEILLEIKTDAQMCRSSNASEAAWNSDVHSPLLKLALKPCEKPRLRRHVMTSTRINSIFIPPMKEGSYYDVAGSKMVDYAVALHPEVNDPLDLAIHRVLQHSPTSTHYFNHTAYDPIRFAPTAVSIETKTGANGLQEARLQLGIWIASWSFRLHQLLDRRQIPDDNLDDVADASNPQTLIPVPVIIVVEHDWKLLFACDRGNRIDIIGDIAIGDTKSIDGLFIIVAVLRRLASWIQSDFRSWLEDVLP